MPRTVRILKPAPPPALAALVAEYLDESAARVRTRSLEMYQAVLERGLLPWLEQESITELAQLDQRAVSRWVSYLRTTHRTPRGGELSEESVRSYARTANSFLRWLQTRGQLSQVRAQTPKRRKRTLDVLSEQEVDALEAAAWTERDKLLIRLLWSTGARLGEILDLRERDLMQAGRRHYYIRLRGKTGERPVGIEPGLYRRLERFIKHGRPEGYSGDRVFVGLRRLVGGGYRTPLRGTIEGMMREAAAKAGIDKRVYPHLLRHSAATHMLRRGMNPLLVAQILGHADLSMINAVYSHLSMEDAHAALLRVMSQESE